ncbi:MAG TPA: DinB family protein [Ohtaekwangia sp.]|uniref:DinB family protein n=1 Tax=Ohtaekwangia sp. TaxID=2066019 RepID=UPI002F92316F
MTTTMEKKQLSIGTLLTDLAVYNAWANETFVNWLRTKPAELMEREVASSFPSIKGTMVHIWDTQRFWASVLEQVPAPPSFRQGYDGTTEDVWDGIVEQSRAMADFVATLSEAAWTEEVEFYTPYIQGIQSRAEFLNHCLTHSGYHRGQVVTIARNVGITDVPMSDYSFYLLRVKQK